VGPFEKTRQNRKVVHMNLDFGDRAKVVESPETTLLGLAGLIGVVYGVTKPSVTGVEVIGGTQSDLAFNLNFAGKKETLWFAPNLLEFVDHGAGMTASIGKNEFVRTSSGKWEKKT
jgi:hypothetical protein